MTTDLSPAKPRSPLVLHLPPSPAFPDGWSGNINEARLLQTQLAKQVSLDVAAGPFLHVAGVDAGLEDHGRVVRAAAVLLDARSLQPLEQVVARMPTTMPYVPGLLSFRELPAVLAALAQLTIVPDLVLCDGQGIAHPRRLGIAAHLGVWTGWRTIGVAKKRLCGAADEPGLTRGAAAPLFDRGEHIGTLLRTRDRVAPLIVSPGHRVGLAQAPEIVLAMTTRYRLPEPTRLADRLASQRDRRPVQPDLVQR